MWHLDLCDQNLIYVLVATKEFIGLNKEYLHTFPDTDLYSIPSNCLTSIKRKKI